MKNKQQKALILYCCILLLFTGIHIKNSDYSENEYSNFTFNQYPDVSTTDPNAFLTKWDTTLADLPYHPDNQIELPLVSNGIYNFFVQWGDGTNDTIMSWDQPETTHVYSTPGAYIVNITGSIKGWSFYNYTYGRLNLEEIQQWGCLGLGNSGHYFSYCRNMKHLATDALNLTGTYSLHKMFYYCDSLGNSGDFSSWDVSHITDMSYMFSYVNYFNDESISGWNVSHVEDMSGMFRSCLDFSINIGGWNVSNVKRMYRMFYHAFDFNSDIEQWDVSRVTNMSYLFYHCEKFNRNISGWDVSSVLDMSGMFSVCRIFNQDIGGWNVSNVQTMRAMFSNAWDFQYNLSSWDVSIVTDMSQMFVGLDYDLGIGSWDVSRVTTMMEMFFEADSELKGLENWNVSSVTDMQGMFSAAEFFNQNISMWDVSSVTNMYGMFSNAYLFNQDIGTWDVSSVTDTCLMFRNASSFDQNLGEWNVSNVEDMYGMFDQIVLSTENYDSILQGWSQLSLQSDVRFSGGLSKYSRAARNERKIMIDQYSWEIIDGGPTYMIEHLGIFISIITILSVGIVGIFVQFFRKQQVTL